MEKFRSNLSALFILYLIQLNDAHFRPSGHCEELKTPSAVSYVCSYIPFERLNSELQLALDTVSDSFFSFKMKIFFVLQRTLRKVNQNVPEVVKFSEKLTFL